MKILVINPGSTSTKIGVYEDTTLLWKNNIHHDADRLKEFKCVSDQYAYRKDLILSELGAAGYDINDFKAVIGRGGLLSPLEGGVYAVSQKMLDELKTAKREHASNLGAIIAHDIASSIDGCRSFIADPVVVDELQDVARLSGLPELPRVSIFHALNQKAIARRYAKEVGKQYEDMNLIVVHMGGGISIGAHSHGRVIDVNNALGRVAEDAALAGDEKARLVNEAMIYGVAKSVGEMFVVLRCQVDAILVTGGMAHSKYLMDMLSSYIDRLAPIKIYPGEDELGALAENAYNVLTGIYEVKTY